MTRKHAPYIASQYSDVTSNLTSMMSQALRHRWCHNGISDVRRNIKSMMLVVWLNHFDFNDVTLRDQWCHSQLRLHANGCHKEYETSDVTSNMTLVTSQETCHQWCHNHFDFNDVTSIVTSVTSQSIEVIRKWNQWCHRQHATNDVTSIMMSRDVTCKWHQWCHKDRKLYCMA